MSFEKICKVCQNKFISESKNKIYCSDKCAKRARKKLYRSRKMKKYNAIKRGDDKEIELLIKQAYKLSHEVSKMCLFKKCSCKDSNHICEGTLVLHHIDHNVLNTSPQNLMWVCEKYHREIHNNEEDCSLPEELKAYVMIRKQSEIRERNKKNRNQIE